MSSTAKSEAATARREAAAAQTEAVAPTALPPARAERRPSTILFLLGALLVLAIGVVIVLVVFPTEHVSSRAATLDARPASVYSLISNVAEYPSWRTGVQRVEILDDDGAGPRFREHREESAITFRIEVAERNSQFRIRIDDDAVPFEGSWTFALAENPNGTDLTILEAGHAYSELFQLLSVAGFSTPGTKEQLLTDLRSALRGARELP